MASEELDRGQGLLPFIHRAGDRRFAWSDLYVVILRTRWRWLIPIYGLSFLVFNAIFGWLYWMDPEGVVHSDGTFADSFFFSVQTFGAIGYGHMYADSLWSHVVVTFESVFSLAVLALLTGLVFAKFARPHARVLFSDVAVVETRNGRPTLTLRMANERGNDVVEANVSLSVLQREVTAEGATMRRFYPLRLERDHSPVFLMSWQIFHVIDEESPLHGLSIEDMVRDDLSILVSISGLDGTFGQTVHARYYYRPSDLRLGYRFRDIVQRGEGGHVTLHYERFHDIVADVERRENVT